MPCFGEKQIQIEREAYAFGEGSPNDPVWQTLGLGTKAALEQLKAEGDQLIREGFQITGTQSMLLNK